MGLNFKTYFMIDSMISINEIYMNGNSPYYVIKVVIK